MFVLKSYDMKMPRIKVEWSFLTIVLFPLAFDLTAAVHLSNERATMYPDQTFVVTCRDEAGRSVSWSGPKGPLGAKGPNIRVETSSYGTNLFFFNITQHDGGVYTCSAGDEKKKFHLFVEVPIKFMDTSSVQTGRENTDVTLRCEVRGGDKLIVTWSVEGGKLNESKFEQIGDGLLIKNVTRADSRTYICKATQTSTGNTLDKRIKLKVLHKPMVPPHLVWAEVEPAWGILGTHVNLTCEVESEPPPKFEWFRKNEALPTNPKHGRFYDDSHKSILQLFIKDMSVYGIYLCNVSNNIGTLVKKFNLQQGWPPPPPEIVELKANDANLLNVGVIGPTIDNKTITKSGMEPIGYQLQYRKFNANTDWNHSYTQNFPTSAENSYHLTDLLPNTEYEVRAATRNVAGISEFTNASIFKTSPSGSQSIVLGSSSCYIHVIWLTLFLFLFSW